MEVGSLFFKLGFKGEGENEAKKFEDNLASIDEVALRLTNSLEKMANVLEKIAIKMGAMQEAAVSEPETTGKKRPALHLVTDADIPKLKTGKELLDNIASRMSSIGDKAKMAFPIVQDKVAPLLPMLSGLTSSLVAAGVAITFFSNKAAEYSIGLSRFSGLTGLSSEKLQDLQARTAASGFSIEQLSGTIRSLQKTAIDIRMGKADGTPWMLLGINPSMDPFETFDQLQKVIKTMSEAKFTYFAESAGLSEDMITLLREMREGPEAKRRFLLSEDEIKTLKDFTFTANVAGTDFKNMIIKLGAALAPFGKFIMEVFGGVTNILGAVVLGMKGIFSWLNITSEKLILFGTLWAVALGGPVALFAGLFLLFDDLIAYFNGEDSLIGVALDQFGKLFSAIFETMKWQFQGILFWFDDLWRKITGIGDTIGGYISQFMSFGADVGAVTLGTASSLGPSNMSNKSQVINNNINVTGANDPVITGKEIQRQINQKITNANIETPNPGR